MFWNCRYGCSQHEGRSGEAFKEGLSHARGINVVIDEENKITIDFHVIVSYGVSIITVSDNLIETVKYKVEAFTGMEIKKMNIYVEGVRVID